MQGRSWTIGVRRWWLGLQRGENGLPADRHGAAHGHRIFRWLEFAIFDVYRIELATIGCCSQLKYGRATIVPWFRRRLERHSARQNSQIQPQSAQQDEPAARTGGSSRSVKMADHLVFLDLSGRLRKDTRQVFGPIWVSPRPAASATCLRRSSSRARRSSSASLMHLGHDTPSR